MTVEVRLGEALASLAGLAQDCVALVPVVNRIAARYQGALGRGRTLFFAGNGGGAALAQHVAAEYVVRYRERRQGLTAIALTADSAVLTAAGNDLGFERIFARQVEALCRAGDVVTLCSTSGRSPNLLAAARSAREREASVVAFLGAGGGELAALADEALIVPTDQVSRIQEIHLAIHHAIVEGIETVSGGKG